MRDDRGRRGYESDCVLGPARKSPCRRSFEIWAWRQGDVFFLFLFSFFYTVKSYGCGCMVVCVVAYYSYMAK